MPTDEPERTRENITLGADDELNLEEVQGNCLELAVEIEPGDATEVGVSSALLA